LTVQADAGSQRAADAKVIRLEGCAFNEPRVPHHAWKI
jgi:hypothetical protein